MGSDTHMLMDRRQASDTGPVFDHHVAGHVDCVRENDVVPDFAIMRHVRIRHDQAVTPDDRLARGPRSTIECGVLTHHRAVPHEQMGGFTFVLEILRITSDDGALRDLALLAQRRIPLHKYMWPKHRASADHNPGSDD